MRIYINKMYNLVDNLCPLPPTNSPPMYPISPIVPLDSIQDAGPQQPDTIRIVCISDTHSQTDRMPQVPYGDILIHAGDFTTIGHIDEICAFNQFLKSLPHTYKVVVPGNHDLLFDPYPSIYKDKYYEKISADKYSSEDVRSIINDNCIYLFDSMCQLFGYNIYGSPWVPIFGHWAFNLPAAELEEKWKLIPDNTDILIVHGPPSGIGDILATNHKQVGCKALLNTIQSRVKPILGVFGHIHEGYGAWRDINTIYLNASIVNIFRDPVNKPFVIDVPKK